MSRAAASNNFLLPNATFVVELILFAVILGVLWKFVVTPLQRVLVQRQDLIRTQAEETRKAQEGLTSAEATLRETLDEARSEAASIRDEARARGKQLIGEAQASAQAEADRVVQSGRAQLDSESERLVSELRADIGRVAVDLAGRIVGEPLAQRIRHETVEDFLGAVHIDAGRLSIEHAHAPRVGEPA